MANKRGLESDHLLANALNGKRSKTDAIELESDNSQYDDTEDGQNLKEDQDNDDVEDEDEYGTYCIFMMNLFAHLT